MRVQIRAMTGAAALAVLAACSDSSGPDQAKGSFDPKKVQDGIAAVERVANAPAIKSFQALGGRIGSAQAAPAQGASSHRLIGAIQQIAGILRPDVKAQLVPVIRSVMLGKTLVYDPATAKYVASDRTGAPANGVRFILYETNPATGVPNVANETGRADLMDVGAGSANSAGLRLVIASGTTTYLDYRFDLGGTIAAAQVHVVGFMSDGTDQVNFDVTTTGQLFGRGGTVTLDATLDVPSKQFGVTAKFTGKAGDDSGDGHVEMTVTTGTDQVALTSTTTAGQLDATVKVNGNLFATAVGPTAAPVIKGEGGRDLTADELTALGQIVAFAGGVFDVLGGLLAPVGVLLLVGLGL